MLFMQISLSALWIKPRPKNFDFHALSKPLALCNIKTLLYRLIRFYIPGPRQRKIIMCYKYM